MSRVVHTQTPSLAVLEPRGQVALEVAYCRSRPEDLAQRRITRTRYNTGGQAVAQWDPRLHDLHNDDPTVPPNLATVCSLSGQVLSTQSVDAGLRVQLFGEAGQGVYFQDGRGTRRQVEFDALLRPLAVFEQDLCTERFSYGGSSAGHNQCGQLIRHDDPAGTRHFPEYAMGGAVLDQVQQFLKTLDTPDWPAPPDQRDDLLELGEGARTLSQFNALGEALQQTDAAGNRQGSNYTVGGQLREAWLQLTGSPSRKILVSATAYDAHGRTERKSLGNGVVSQFDYCPQDGRLLRLHSRRSSGEPLQDLHYVYDPVGNIVSIEDKTLAVRFFANQRIDPINRYAYDSLYQLIQATGFEAGTARQGPDHRVDPLAVANFRQTYRYDMGGNLLELIHHGPQSHGRVLTAARYSNRCLPERDGVPPTEAEIAAAFDASGNLLELEAGRALHWDWRNQLAYVRPVERKSALDDTEGYVYGGGGLRLRKVHIHHARSRAIINETRYLQGMEVRNIHGSVLLVISAGDVQVLHWETTPPKKMANNQFRYNLKDHLGSWTLELDSEAKIISRETYHPFGSTALNERGDSSEESYRTLRYSGEEGDVTGLYYYGFRFFNPYAQRWLNTDPSGAVDGLNLYCMVGNNPINFVDHHGLDKTDDDEIDEFAAAGAARSERVVSLGRGNTKIYTGPPSKQSKQKARDLAMNPDLKFTPGALKTLVAHSWAVIPTQDARYVNFFNVAAPSKGPIAYRGVDKTYQGTSPSDDFNLKRGSYRISNIPDYLANLKDDYSSALSDRLHLAEFSDEELAANPLLSRTVHTAHELQPVVEEFVTTHIENAGNIIPVLAGGPGAHAEVRLVNTIVALHPNNTEAVLANTHLFTQVIFGSAAPSNFVGCFNCSGVIPAGVKVLTGRSPHNYDSYKNTVKRHEL